MSNRPRTTIAREYALKFLYHLQLTEFKEQKNLLEQGENLNIDLDSELAIFSKSYSEFDEEHPDNCLNENTFNMAKNLINIFLNNYQETSNILERNTKGWKKANIDKIDITIILLAISEMKYLNTTPKKVIINEAINMAKKFGKEESFSFVNGVLDSILTKELCD